MADHHPTTACANAEGPTRRNLLLALPVAGLAAAVPALANADEEDPILPLYRQWLAARDDWHRHADLPGNEDWNAPQSQAASDRKQAAFSAMVEMTPTSMAAMAALIHVLWDLDGPTLSEGSEGYLAEAEEPNCKLMRALWRGASGQHGFPPTGRIEIMA